VPSEQEQAAEREAIAALTEAFVAVRYGGRRIDAESLPRLKSFWEVLKRRLNAAKS
jgi:hypothetical protein